MTGGRFDAQTIAIQSSATMDLTSDLTVVSVGDLTIDGTINLPDLTNSPPGTPSPGIVLISLNGTVRIGINGVIGGGVAAPGSPSTVTARPAVASSGAGGNGSHIVIMGAVIEMRGEVTGNDGGGGGNAVANSVTPPGGGMFSSDYAEAVAGEGGFGGDVVLCAAEVISLGGALPHLTATGGRGGEGGYADAWADGGEQGLSIGGKGNAAGDVVIIGTSSGAPVQVSLKQTPVGGDGWDGGNADARGGAGGVMNGGPANTAGGAGGTGGTVQFINAVVQGQGTAQAGAGGQGGFADARGGVGSNGRLIIGRGGNATAAAGNGGAAGATPTIPLPNGGSRPGTAGANGSGGDADARPGNGGTSTGPFNGGTSGTGSATGGANGAGTAPGAPPGTPVTTAAVAAVGKPGGIAAPATQAGTL